MLTDREWATAVWLVALAAFAGRSPGVRQSLRELARQLLHPKIAVPLVLYALWIAAVVWVAWHLDAWRPSMIKGTLLWSVPALALFAGSTHAASEEGFFRRRVREVVGVSLFVEFYVNVATYPFVLELILQPATFLAIGVSTIGEYYKEHARAKHFADVFLGILLLVFLVPSTLHLIGNFRTIDLRQATRDLLLRVWLTVGALPFIYLLSLYATYEWAYVHIKIATVGGRVPLHSMLALARAFHFRHGALARLRGGNWFRELALAETLRDALAVIAEQERTRREEEAAERQKAADLTRYAGVDGTDADGRRLDKREFSETITALETLAGSQMGWYRRGNRYRRELLKRFESVFSHGLPEDHGIEMTVKKGGQSWYAWRRTVSGWCFAIGAAGPPPDQWFHAGPDPPSGYPGEDPAWGDEPFARGPDWEGGP